MIPQEILESQKVRKYLSVRNLEKAYLKATRKFLVGDAKSIDLKIRKPKSDENFQFRINHQFRAIGFFEKNIFKVFKIDNHQ